MSAPEAVERWEIAGGHTRVRAVEADRAQVDLLRCDGGEVVESITLTTPKDVRWAAERLAADAE